MPEKNITDKKSKKKIEVKKSVEKKKLAKKSVAKVDKKKKVVVNKEQVKRKDRSFKVIYTDPTGDVVMEGRYCGAKPKQAACKALTGIYKIFKEEGQNLKNDEVKFGVYETTRGSKNKKYWYTGKKEELETPIKLFQIPNTEEGMKLLKKWETEREKKMSAEEKEKLENKKKNKKEGGKRYCSAETIEEIGGFKKIFGKEDVKPAIVYNFTNDINKASKEECTHLLDVKKVIDDDEDEDKDNKKGGSKKSAKKSEAVSKKSKSSSKSDEKSSKKVSKKSDSEQEVDAKPKKEVKKEEKPTKKSK